MIDIQAGDVVVCVDASPRVYLAPDQIETLRQLREGGSYRVTALVETLHGIGLCLAGVRVPVGPRGREAWNPNRFRKVQKADDKFVEQMRAIRPAKQPARVPSEAERSVIYSEVIFDGGVKRAAR